MIHPSAIVEPGARLAPGVSVGAYSIIGAGVEVGEGTSIGPHVVLAGRVRIGRHNRIWQFCSLGEPPQDKKYAGEDTAVEIGDGAEALAPECCDLLLIDAFADEHPPAALVSQAFFDAAWLALEAPGILVLNLMNDDPKLDQRIARLERAFGGAVLALPALYDRIVLNIVDALICQYEGGQRGLLHYSAVLDQLRFSRDPVALDMLSIKELDRQRRRARAPNVRPNLELYRNAALLELGESELSKMEIETLD